MQGYGKKKSVTIDTLSITSGSAAKRLIIDRSGQ